jgi:hypothetical protein
MTRGSEPFATGISMPTSTLRQAGGAGRADAMIQGHITSPKIALTF